MTIRIQLIDLLTVLCDRVGVVLLGQLYQGIVLSWIRVSDVIIVSRILLLTGRGWLKAEERILVVRKVNVLLLTIS